jgi:hypothetical protein
MINPNPIQYGGEFMDLAKKIVDEGTRSSFEESSKSTCVKLTVALLQEVLMLDDWREMAEQLDDSALDGLAGILNQEMSKRFE